MTDKARELLERTLKQLNPWHPGMGEQQFDYTLREEICAYLAEPEVPFVRLTDEELKECWGFPYSLSTDELRRFARAIETKLMEKNK